MSSIFDRFVILTLHFVYLNLLLSSSYIFHQDLPGSINLKLVSYKNIFDSCFKMLFLFKYHYDKNKINHCAWLHCPDIFCCLFQNNCNIYQNTFCFLFLIGCSYYEAGRVIVKTIILPHFGFFFCFVFVFAYHMHTNVYYVTKWKGEIVTNRHISSLYT